MVNKDPEQRLKIKKGQGWELWLVSPTREIILGAFNTLEELNQAEITLYNAWEKPYLPYDPYPGPAQH
jgi:hypothetical protein